MRAFVAGATGYVGKALVRLLTERGIETIAHVRPDSSRLSEHQEHFEGLGATVSTAAWDDASMTEAFQQLQPTLVFCCIGTTRARKSKSNTPENETYEAVDYGLTAILVHASSALAAPPRFVYLSSTGVTENAPGAYMQARWKAECEIKEAGLPYTIARPSFITGPNREEDRPGERIGAAIGDALLEVGGLMGMRSIRDRYRSLTDVQLATGLVEFGLSESGLNRIVDAAELRRGP